MQATVHRFEAATGDGSVLTDAGELLAFSPEAFASSRLRHLRIGQRLTVVVEPQPGSSVPHVTSMRLETVAVLPPGPSRT